MDATTTVRPAGFSIEDAARQIGISRTSLYRLIDSERIRMVKIGRRSIIPASEIDRVIEHGAPLDDDDAA